MNILDRIGRVLRKIGLHPHRWLDAAFRIYDRKHLYATRNIRLIPGEKFRQSGNSAYAEWAYVTGIVQTLMFLHLEEKEDNKILDVGCGTGLLAIASEPFLGRCGRYTGIDLIEKNIAFCRRQFPRSHFDFVHVDAANAEYAPQQQRNQITWPFENDTFDFATALSVWTHLNEEDAVHYLQEVSRVLKSGGKAVITCFLLDAAYRNGCEQRTHAPGRFHSTLQDKWIFDQPSYHSTMWFHPQWADPPERAIGFSPAGLDLLISGSGLELVQHYLGNWKEAPGVLFQDVLILRKT